MVDTDWAPSPLTFWPSSDRKLDEGRTMEPGQLRRESATRRAVDRGAAAKQGPALLRPRGQTQAARREGPTWPGPGP